MNSIVVALLYMLVALTSASCTSAELCPSTEKHLEWSSACFEGTGLTRRVKPANKSKIVADRAGFATIVIDAPRELVAVDRSGAVRVPGIFHTGDFDFPYASEAIGRFQVITKDAKGEPNTKCGYFDSRNFKIVIPAIYDQCMAFANGTGAACKDCTKVCTESECQSSKLIGGQGFFINRQNNIVKRFFPPSLEQACIGNRPGKLVPVTPATFYLQCSPEANSPFDKLE